MLASTRSGAELFIDGAQAESVKKSVKARRKATGLSGLLGRLEFKGILTRIKKDYPY
jgi:hypothetical protein